ncbi:MAG: Lipopolysaccharide assembly protein B [Syntrophus sp. SKADARSKE-3]|nr:Lipopolysaccharide assembly protein B [Syntrophus sp. SKADARSKE-3]
MNYEDAAQHHAIPSDPLEKTAEDHVKAGRYDEAIHIYQKLIERHPEEDSFALALAWAYHDHGQIGDAIDCFEKLFEKEISRRIFTGFAFDELVRIFKREGLYDRLLNLCERVIAVQPADFALLGDLAEACLKTGQAERAAGVYRKMIEMEPEAAVVYCGLGSALLAKDDFTGAEEAYKNAVAVEPEKAASFYCRLADEYRRMGHGNHAIEAIGNCLVLNAAEPAYYLMMGDILIESGKIDEGTQMYGTAIRLKPSFAGAYYHRLGNTMSGMAYHEQAANAFRNAMTADPSNPFYRLKLAEAYVALGRGDLALELIE